MPNQILCRTNATFRVQLCAAAAAIVILTGCDSDPAVSPTPPAPSVPEPEAKFDHIFDDVSRLVGAEEALPDRDNGMEGGGNTQWTNFAEKKLKPPSEDSGNYHGEITITRRYSVTMYTYNDDEKSGKDDAPNRNRNPNGFDPLADPGEGSSSDLPDFQPSGGRSLPTGGGSPIRQREGEDVKTYKLVYVDDNWRLLTEFDPDSESAIQAAFEYALKRQ